MSPLRLPRSSRSAARSRIVVAAAVFVACFASMPFRATAQDVLTRVPVDLGGGAVKTQLPFDETFLLMGKAAPELLSVSVAYRAGTRATRSECATAFDSASAWTRPESWVRDPGVAADSFFVVIDALAPNTIHGFCFQTVSRLSDTELNALRGTVADRVEAYLRGKFASGDLTDAQIRDLSVALRSLVPQKPGRVVVFPPGSIFDSKAFGGTVGSDDIRRIQVALGTAELIGAAGERDDAIFNTTGKVKDLGNALTALRDDAGLAVLVNALRDPQRADLARRQASALGLAGLTLTLSADAIAGVAEGRVALALDAMPSVDDAPITAIWTATGLSGRIGRLTRTMESLAALRLLLVASANEGVITTAEARRLVAVVTEAEGVLSQELIALRRLGDALILRRSLIETATKALDVSALAQALVLGSSIGNFEARAKWYTSADVGVAMFPRFSDASPYYGANFYCAAVNKRVPLRLRGGFCKRFALTLGLTTSSVARANERSDLFASVGVMAGGGVRITDAARLGFGVLLFKHLEGNPLLDAHSLGATPYLSTSFDVDAKAALGKVGELLFK